MKVNYRVLNARGPANDPSTDRALTFAMRYTLPLAIAGIVALLLFIWWGLSL